MHVSGSGAFTGLSSTCKTILVEGGLLGFYQGCLTNLLRTTPAAAVTFTSFELINKQLRLWIDSPSSLQLQEKRHLKSENKRATQKNEIQEEEKVALAPPFASVSSTTMLKDSLADINAHVSELSGTDRDST